MTNNNHYNQQREGFNSKFGALMAIVGSAVGLGNIWRFPYLVGENGGAAFIFIYLAIVLVIGVPLVLSEYIIGKSTHKGSVGAFKTLAPKKIGWKNIGLLSIIASFTLLGIYNVVSGWVLESLILSITTGFQNQTPLQIQENFQQFTTSTYLPIIYSTAFILISALIVGRGIEKGVEKWNKILIPLLFALLIALCINSLTLSGTNKAIEFLTKPDWSKVTMQTFLDALGQVFFTLSVGIGVMITYGSYVRGKENMLKSKLTSSIVDSMSAMLAALMIFPAVYTFNIQPTQGPELVFLALPNVFAQMSGGWVMSIVFFGVLVIAAITSAISVFEVLVTTAIEEFKMSRTRATIIVAIISLALSGLCASSMTIFNNFDSAANRIMLPAFGLLTVLFLGWIMKKGKVKEVFTSGGRYSTKIFWLFYFIVRFIAPAAIALILLGAMGVL